MIRRLIQVGPVLLVTLLVGCFGSHTILPGQGVNAIVTTAEVSPTEIASGEYFRIAISSRNPTSAPVTLHFSSSCLQSFAVRDKNGRVVPLGLVCTTFVPIVTLQAGESMMHQFGWAGTTEYGGGPRLAPGEYTITGELNATERHVESVAVKVTLLP